MDIYKTADTLRKHGFKATVFATAEEAKKALLGMIPLNKTIGMGGSMTLINMGLVDELYSRGNKIVSSHIAQKEGTDPWKARVNGMNTDIYMCSTNALTEKGELVNIDGFGNRVAAMFFGPKEVIVVAGRNKIVANRAAAMKRIKSVACPLNAKRLKKDTPCFQTGECGDCDSPDRMCCVTVIIERPPTGRDIHIVLVDEDLGY